MIAEWTQDTTSLFNQISRWSYDEGWHVESEIEYVDLPDRHEDMEKHGFRVTTPEGRIHIDPAGSREDGTAIVNMYAWPTLVRIRLLHMPGSPVWKPVTDVGMELRYDWNQQDFIRLAQDMLTA